MIILLYKRTQWTSKYDYDMFMCKNISCDKHNDNIQELYKQILNLCITSAEESILMTGAQREEKVAGWNDFVR